MAHRGIQNTCDRIPKVCLFNTLVFKGNLLAVQFLGTLFPVVQNRDVGKEESVHVCLSADLSLRELKFDTFYVE